MLLLFTCTQHMWLYAVLISLKNMSIGFVSLVLGNVRIGLISLNVILVTQKFTSWIRLSEGMSRN